MGIIEKYYREVVDITCRVCEINPENLFCSNKECYVDARCLIIMRLSSNGFTDARIADLTGLTRQAVNRVRNTFPYRYDRSFMLISYQQQISNELAKDQQCTSKA